MNNAKNSKNFLMNMFNLSFFAKKDEDEDVLDKGQYKLKMPLSYVLLTKESIAAMVVTFIFVYFYIDTKQFFIVFSTLYVIETILLHFYFVKYKDSEVEQIDILKFWYDLKKKYTQREG